MTKARISINGIEMLVTLSDEWTSFNETPDEKKSKRSQIIKKRTTC